MLPLTHHQIFALIGPFVRAGRHVDLQASDRLERRLVFQPTERAGPGGRVRETLLLEQSDLERSDAAPYRLTRLLEADSALQVRLAAQGSDLEALLRAVDAVPLERQLRVGSDRLLGLDFEMRGSAPPVLTGARARLPGWTLALEVPATTGSAELHLQPLAAVTAPMSALPLPEDVFAVLGRKFSPLRDRDGGWRATLHARAREPRRSVVLEEDFERAASHLATTLAEAPGRFHERWLLARWRVFGRRALPLLLCLALIGAVAALPRAHIAEHSAWRMLIFNAPPLLLAMFFCLREIPRIELPAPPRRPRVP